MPQLQKTNCASKVNLRWILVRFIRFYGSKIWQHYTKVWLLESSNFWLLKGVCLAIFVLAAVLGMATGAIAQKGSLEYKLGTGDKIRIIVFEEEDLSGNYEIGGNGYISVPLIGEVKASNLSERGLEKAIEEKLLDGFLKNPRVSIQVLNYRPFYILGEVEKPGGYPYVNGMTIINAVAMGGGFTYRAAEGKIYVTRANDPNQEKIRVNIRDKVLPGDVVRVEERLF